jgi:V/A-type H+/Na+-transporting ATPase subunit E
LSKAASDTLQKVSNEFEAEVLAEVEAGRVETLAKVESVRKGTAEAVAKILETSVKQSDSARRQIIGAAELETRNAQLKSLERAVNESIDLAKKQISGSSGAAYEKAIARLINEGLEMLGPRARVQCASKDKKAVASAIKKLDGKAKVTLDDDPIESMGGVVLTTPEGSIRFDNTFEARLERMRPMLRKEVAAILTGDD